MTQDKINKAVELIDDMLENKVIKLEMSGDIDTPEPIIDFCNELKSLLQSDNEGMLVDMSTRVFKDINLCKCPCCQNAVADCCNYCNNCGTKLIWPNNQNKSEES